jgi:NAD(P)-dependent dehydrogenase (short-subunit alcohol dehydrogenase family)
LKDIPKIFKLFDLTGRNIIVTGSSGILGSQYADTLSQAGANVILVDINDKNNNLEKTLRKKYKTNAKFYCADISIEKNVLSLKKNILTDFKKIDGLINNAAYTNIDAIKNSDDITAPFEKFSFELWKKILDVDLSGVFNCCKVFGSQMVKQRKGTIVNISSIYGIVGNDQRIYGNSKINSPVSYAAAKGGIITLTRYLAAYWHKKNIRVNTLTPGGILDKKYQNKKFIKKYSEKTILGRMARSDEYNGALLFLMSDASSYMTGANLVIDGGWTAW